MDIKITNKSIIIKWGDKKEIKRKTELKSPGYRDILFLENTVIKFDVPSRGHFGTQCKKEVNKYFEIEEEDKKYFATILGYGDGWLAMEKVNFLHPGQCDLGIRNNAKVILDQLQNKYNLWDLHSENWGVKENGEPIIFDYGVNNE